MGKRWTKDEEQFLHEHYAAIGPQNCANKLHRSYQSVTIRAHLLKLTNGWVRNWSGCKQCGDTDKPHHAYGLCRTCYGRQYTAPLIICKHCGQKQPHAGHGLCNSCYCHQWSKEHPSHYYQWKKANPDYKPPNIICKECGKERLHGSHGLCQICYGRKWRRDHPVRSREKSRRRRAHSNHVTIEPVSEQRIYALYNNTCIYCGSKENLSLDHIVPLARSGMHCEDNLVVARGHCNSSKGSNPLIDWLKTQPYALAWVA